MFAGFEHVRFVLRPSGVFHPKIYLFEDGPGGWVCICGSANFTAGAMTKNQEACVLIEGRDVPNSLRKDFSDVIERAWRLGKVPTSDERRYYRMQWQLKQSRISELTGRFTRHPKGSGTQGQDASDEGHDLHEISLVRMAWPQFMSRVLSEQRGQAYKGRLSVLEVAQKLFSSRRSFADLSAGDRRRIAGFASAREEDGLDWKWFGNMQGAGYFKRLVNEQPGRIARAIDAIPLHRPVTQQDFARFVDHLDDLTGVSLGAGTRLLTMKRPDTFVTFNTQSRRRLCAECGLNTTIDWEGYWNSVIGRIRQSIWFQEPVPTQPQAERIWHNRVAMLDSLYYDHRH